MRCLRSWGLVVVRGRLRLKILCSWVGVVSRRMLLVQRSWRYDCLGDLRSCVISRLVVEIAGRLRVQNTAGSPAGVRVQAAGRLDLALGRHLALEVQLGHSLTGMRWL